MFSQIVSAIGAMIFGVAICAAYFWFSNKLLDLIFPAREGDDVHQAAVNLRRRGLVRPWLFLGPALFLLVVYLVYPVVATFILSFYGPDGSKFVGGANYLWALSDTEFRQSIFDNILWLAVVPAACTFFGLVIAVMTDRIWWGNIAKAVIFMPMAISFVGASVIWKFIYEYRGGTDAQIGLLNAVVQLFGGTPEVWITIPFWNNFFLMVMLIWIQTGFAMVILSAALRGIPEETIEAAVIDGANGWQIFWKIMVPQVWGTIATVWTTITILVLKVFDIVLGTTAGQAKKRGGADMIGSLGRPGPARIFVHAAVLLIVLLWLLPTLGIFVTALRDKDQIVASGWWTSFAGSSRTTAARLDGPDKAKPDGANFVISGTLAIEGGGTIQSFGLRVQEPAAYKAGSPAELENGETLTINSDGSYRYQKNGAFEADARARRVYLTVATPPQFTLDNYRNVLGGEGIGQSFINSLTVTIPATVIPILIAAFAAYALAWMEFPGRAILIALVVGLIVVPLQMSLIPLLRIYNEIGQIFGVPSKTYPGIWMAHTAFGLAGPSDFVLFVRIILPLSFPALASFAIFQFLWVWNDLLIAMVFLGTDKDHLVLTAALNALLGSRGGNWEILTASAFVTIIIPLLVFFGLQRYLVRGLLAGSVKGG